VNSEERMNEIKSRFIVADSVPVWWITPDDVQWLIDVVERQARVLRAIDRARESE